MLTTMITDNALFTVNDQAHGVDRIVMDMPRINLIARLDRKQRIVIINRECSGVEQMAQTHQINHKIIAGLAENSCRVEYFHFLPESDPASSIEACVARELKDSSEAEPRLLLIDRIDNALDSDGLRSETSLTLIQFDPAIEDSLADQLVVHGLMS